MTENEIRFEEISKKLDSLCLHGEACRTCEKNKCLVFFSRKVANYALAKKVTNIPQGCSMIPNQDLKIYSEKEIIEALALVLLQCKDCRDNHEEDCSVNIVRTCLEYALFGDKLPYRGSTTMYFLDAHKSSERIGKQLKETFIQMKGVHKQ
ncbi:hypothetical protein GTO91_12185 [Heliobacterium undosum]|uniref:Uncharacterized protein n=1 Tax=Heliomicrobium undosum TaxID=121734 RepID=A0A845L1P3_9FIRM|nr:hypothetical protein [Heliomicrobium undosum]MZP30472.1 hypothetical protein [Heliomicrobium undosum]